MGVGALVGISVRRGLDQLAEDDDPGRAAVDAQGATGANVVVDQEDVLIGGIFARTVGVDRLVFWMPSRPRDEVLAELEKVTRLVSV